MARLPNFFLAGFQKCATTWLHHCLQEHPAVFVPPVHGIYFFDINYHKGIDWYRRFYEDQESELVVGDTTVAYARLPWVASRIAEFNPDAKIILCMRNPIERAYSHYWHEKRSGRISYDFGEVLTNIDVFQDWVVTGFYARHIEPFLKHFEAERILYVLNDDVERRPDETLEGLYGFLDVESGFRPRILTERVNRAWSRAVPFGARIPKRGLRARVWWRWGAPARPPGGAPSEYAGGMPEEIFDELVKIFRPEVRRLSDLLERDLGSWLEPGGRGA